ncbi:MAG: ABC transporter substrate-binding protein, partial [Spirochaetaceae bacterium]|nr:ABC transporter substrate-binding protein [Spirochaetaceae bacterium]
SYAPELVILKSSMKKSVGPGLDAVGIEQLYLDLETPEDYLRELSLLGQVFGDSDRAAALTEFYRRKSDEVGSRVSRAVAGGAGRPRVLVLQAQAAPGGVFEVPPESWMQTILTERAGGLPVWKGANPGSGWARVGIEQIAAWDPDVIFCISYKDKASAVAAAFRADPRLTGLRAIATGKVFGFPQDFYSWDQPDVRWILGLGWMAKKLHPAAFASVSTLGEARLFYEFCYGIPSTSFETLIAPRLSGDYGD